ncbi:SNARE associated Golgi protein [Kutzneria sp. CA-103260]|nr:SNARE associated Golgi protein [Kutzneria sp. CA-103260]
MPRRSGDRFAFPGVTQSRTARSVASRARAGAATIPRCGRALLARRHNPHLAKGVVRGEALFERYGHGKAIVLARFIPIIRTVLNPLAGILSLPTKTFTLGQVSGGLLWNAAGHSSRSSPSWWMDRNRKKSSM